MATASTPYLEAEGLVKRYGGTLALDRASFRAAKGEVHALVGENGAGKSTFIKVLTGAVTADEGTLRVGDVASSAATPGSPGEPGWRRSSRSCR